MGPEGLWPRPPGDGSSNLVHAREAHKGTAVRVREGNRREALCGMVGTVEDRWGSPDYPALEVRLEDGHTELFWFHELDRVRDFFTS